MKKLLNQWINKLVAGTHNHFACYLPKSQGLISRIILKLFFVNIQIPRGHVKFIRELENTGIVIIVNKYKSYFEYLFYHLRYQHERLLYPGIGFDYRFFLWQPVFRFFRILLSIADHFFKHFFFRILTRAGLFRKNCCPATRSPISRRRKRVLPAVCQIPNRSLALSH
ncbi:MAG: hypothetical protein R2860_06520 [Desulfobacterales bacterium]